MNIKTNGMKKSMMLTWLLFLIGPVVHACTVNELSDDDNGKWKLVWEDNFEVEGLPDSKVWSYEEGYIRNNEAQFYTKGRLENARVEDGNLIIEARNDNWKDNKITSASLHTFGKKSI